ncbi:hypothetical protein CEP73_001735 [Providencia stuartii]|nr:hypothetical protein CEP73_001735 [Providencia stuartii]
MLITAKTVNCFFHYFCENASVCLMNNHFVDKDSKKQVIHRKNCDMSHESNCIHLNILGCQTNSEMVIQKIYQRTICLFLALRKKNLIQSKNQKWSNSFWFLLVGL